VVGPDLGDAAVRALGRDVAAPTLRWTNCATSPSGGSRGAKRGPFGTFGVIRSTRKVRQSSRAVSQATRYQRRPQLTSRCGSTSRRLGVRWWLV
jgi:hypothetical protein